MQPPDQRSATPPRGVTGQRRNADGRTPVTGRAARIRERSGSVRVTGADGRSGAESGPDAPDSDASAAEAQRWETLRSYEDPNLYLTMLTPQAEEGAVHPLLRAPAGLTTVSGEMPDTDTTRAYLRHSCDLTLTGDVAAAVTYPLAACALAEEYLVRRVGGASAASASAAAIAAAELGRRTPSPEPVSASAPGSPEGDSPYAARSTALPAGYAGLAHLVGWLAGDRDRNDPAASEDSGDGHRLARLLPPAPSMRAPYRLLTSASRPDLSTHSWWSPRRAAALAASLVAVPGQVARAAVGLVWAGGLLVWVGLTVALLRSPTVQPWVVVVAALALLVTTVLAGLAATALAASVAVPRLLREQGPAEYYGLVPGVPLPDGESPRRRSSELDRLAGVPDPKGVPPLFTWLADALDDLAGLPQGEQGRAALTFGDLWLGRPAAGSGNDGGRDAQFLRRAAADPERRAIELRLVTVDLTRGRPVHLPFAASPRPAAASSGPHPWLFCPRCLGGVLPARVVDQTVAASHRVQVAWAGHRCPRHEVPLLAFPEPWDVPVVVTVRLAASLPGFLRSVPLYTPAATRPDADVTTHWFSGGGPADAPVSMFDAILPRWPTFGLTVEAGADLPGDGPGSWVEVPDVATSGWQPAPTVRIDGPGAFASAALRAATGWRDRAEAELPGRRGRIGVVRRGRGAGSGSFLTDAEILRLALRGHEAGRELRARFTSPDGDVDGQTATDRYRWVRLRSALRDYRRESLQIAARLPLYSDLAATYRVPAAVRDWFSSPVTLGRVDPAWADAAAALAHLRSLSSGGVLDWDTDDGAPPPDAESPLC
jgi:hypothetical protein